jgi:hypothetical protein
MMRNIKFIAITFFLQAFLALLRVKKKIKEQLPKSSRLNGNWKHMRFTVMQTE